MTTLHPDLEALMPEPAGFRTRHRNEPGMIGHYPWTYSDPRRRLYDRPSFEYEDLFTATQMREAILAATERAAKKVEEVGPKEGALKLVTEGFAAAIRARTGGEHDGR